MRTFLPKAQNSEVCTVYRDDEGDALNFSPAEADKATELIGIALGMEEMEAVPEVIGHSPFVIRFFEDDFLRFEREDGEGSVRFTWEEGDELITTIHAARDMAVNERRHMTGPKKSKIGY